MMQLIYDTSIDDKYLYHIKLPVKQHNTELHRNANQEQQQNCTKWKDIQVQNNKWLPDWQLTCATTYT